MVVVLVVLVDGTVVVVDAALDAAVLLVGAELVVVERCAVQAGTVAHNATQRPAANFTSGWSHSRSRGSVPL
jgi:hypothetical protein